jgi:hypothetical protein
MFCFNYIGSLKDDPWSTPCQYFNEYFVYRAAEESLLNCTGLESKGFYVDAGTVDGQPCYVWTRKFQAANSGNASTEEPLGTLAINYSSI